MRNYGYGELKAVYVFTVNKNAVVNGDAPHFVGPENSPRDDDNTGLV